MRSLALLKLIPEILEQNILSRPELATYTQKLSFIEAQMEQKYPC
jgi:hypothetical protein